VRREEVRRKLPAPQRALQTALPAVGFPAGKQDGAAPQNALGQTYPGAYPTVTKFLCLLPFRLLSAL